MTATDIDTRTRFFRDRLTDALTYSKVIDGQTWYRAESVARAFRLNYSPRRRQRVQPTHKRMVNTYYPGYRSRSALYITSDVVRDWALELTNVRYQEVISAMDKRCAKEDGTARV